MTLLKNTFKLLELDMKARRDMFLLMQSGLVGRTHGNRVLWKILSGPALQRPYRDLSNLVTSEVYKARQQFDRPPRNHGDLHWWSWTYYSYPDQKYYMWSPLEAPRQYALQMGPGGKPLAPPQCWGEAPDLR